jgi:hypothetical protein
MTAKSSALTSAGRGGRRVRRPTDDRGRGGAADRREARSRARPRAWWVMNLEPHRSTGGRACPRQRILSDHGPHHRSRSRLEPDHLGGEPRVRQGVPRLIEPEASDVGHLRVTTATRRSALRSFEVPRVGGKDAQDEVLEAAQQLDEHGPADIITRTTVERTRRWPAASARDPGGPCAEIPQPARSRSGSASCRSMPSRSASSGGASRPRIFASVSFDSRS